MACHGVNAALLAATGEMTDTIDRRDVVVDAPDSAGKARLLVWIARALCSRAVLHQRRGGRVTAVTIGGFGSDLERVELLLHLAAAAGDNPTHPASGSRATGVRDCVPTVLATRLRRGGSSAALPPRSNRPSRSRRIAIAVPTAVRL